MIVTDSNKMNVSNAKVVSYDPSTDVWFLKFRNLGIWRAAKPQNESDTNRLVLTTRVASDRRFETLKNKLFEYNIGFSSKILGGSKSTSAKVIL